MVEPDWALVSKHGPPWAEWVLPMLPAACSRSSAPVLPRPQPRLPHAGQPGQPPPLWTLTLAADAQRAGAHALALGVGAHGARDEGVVLDRVLVQALQVLRLRGRRSRDRGGSLIDSRMGGRV